MLCCHFRPELTGPILDHESGLSVLSLPSPGAMLDKMQTDLTQRILDKLGDGLDVGVSGYVVYGHRRGEIKAFWSFSKFDQFGQPQEVSKLQPQPLYLFKDFLRGGRIESQLFFVSVPINTCGTSAMLA